VTYIIYKYNDEKKDIPVYIDKTTILDVLDLKSATTVFLHKILDSKEKVVLINLHGQPKQIVDICGIDRVISVFPSILEAKNFLEDK